MPLNTRANCSEASLGNLEDLDWTNLQEQFFVKNSVDIASMGFALRTLRSVSMKVGDKVLIPQAYPQLCPEVQPEHWHSLTSPLELSERFKLLISLRKYTQKERS
jgi:hypothetical protein